MATTSRAPINRLQTFREWLIFSRNGLVFALIVGMVLFWNSPHSADQISVTIAVPLIIFNCIPFVLPGLSAGVRLLLPESPQKALPLNTQPVELKTLSPKERISVLITIGTVVAMIVCFFAGGAIFAASFTYRYFGVAWAVTPAQHLAYLLFGVTALPLVAVLSFVAGMAYTGRVRDSATALWIYLKTIRPLTHWPTYA